MKNVIPSFIKVRTLFINVKKNCRGLYFNMSDLEMAAHFLHVLQEDKTLFSPSWRIKFIFHSLVFLGFFKSILILFFILCPQTDCFWIYCSKIFMIYYHIHFQHRLCKHCKMFLVFLQWRNCFCCQIIFCSPTNCYTSICVTGYVVLCIIKRQKNHIFQGIIVLSTTASFYR